jgi:hypothetical protein
MMELIATSTGDFEATLVWGIDWAREGTLYWGIEWSCTCCSCTTITVTSGDTVSNGGEAFDVPPVYYDSPPMPWERPLGLARAPMPQQSREESSFLNRRRGRCRGLQGLRNFRKAA